MPRIADSLSLRSGGRPALTLDGDPRLFSSLLSHQDGSTAKRRVARALTRLLIATRMLPLVARRSSSQESAEVRRLSEHLRDVSSSRGHATAATMVMWPVLDRSHRRYLISVDSDGANPLFCKLSTRPDLDTTLFENEHTMLETLRDTTLRGWCTPRSRGLRHSAEAISLVLECPPDKMSHVTWDDLVTRLPLERDEPAGPGSTRPAAELDWYEAACQAPASDAFSRAAVQAARTPISLAFVNGDIKPSNSVRAGGRRWLFDWEFAHDQGPHQTDLVSAIINRTPVGRSGRASDVTRVRQEALRQGVTETDLVMSVLYLSTVRHLGALQVMAEWTEHHDPAEAR